MISPPGQQITDEIECPLLELTQVIFLRRSSLILKAVAICGTQMFIFMQVHQQVVERETIATSRIEYEHDFKDSLL